MTDAPTPSGEKLRDSEIAVIDALRTLLEILVASGIAKADTLQRLFAQKRDAYIQKDMPDAAVIMDVLKGFAQPSSPAVSDEHRKALEKPPQGTA
jgi:hypothetical protein